MINDVNDESDYWVIKVMGEGEASFD